MCVCVCVCGERVDSGESDKMIKISGEVDKSDTYNGFSDISFFIHRISSEYSTKYYH